MIGISSVMKKQIFVIFLISILGCQAISMNNNFDAEINDKLDLIDQLSAQLSDNDNQSISISADDLNEILDLIKL